jgi:hypothetical protein
MKGTLDVTLARVARVEAAISSIVAEGRVVNSNQPEGPEPKARKARGNKSPKPQDPKGKVKIAAYVSLESSRRLGIHATMSGQDRSSIIDQLIREHLRDWVVQYRPSNKPGDEAEPEAEAHAG